jgi:hypothetical protein
MSTVGATYPRGIRDLSRVDPLSMSVRMISETIEGVGTSSRLIGLGRHLKTPCRCSTESTGITDVVMTNREDTALR